MNDEKQIVTTVVLDHESWRMLRDLALLRAVRLGGKPSASAVVRELVRAETSRPGSKPPEGEAA